MVLFAAAGSLGGLERNLGRARVRTVRIVSLDAQGRPPSAWLPLAARRGPFDTVLVTSQHAVSLGVAPWLKERRARRSVTEFWAAGPATARSLRKLGVRPVHRAASEGSGALAEVFRPRARRRILYPRSDRAGPVLARALRAAGHSVFDPVVYRIGERTKLTAAETRELRSADLLVVSSPSGLDALRRRLGPRAFGSLRVRARVLVLGERSARAARRLGFPHPLQAESTTAQRLTRQVLRELRHASEEGRR